MTTRARAASPRFTLLSAAVPGRLRVRVPELLRSPALAAGIVERLTSLASVASVRANSVTGSVLVFFDATQVTVNDLVMEISRGRGVTAVSATRGLPRPRTEGRPADLRRRTSWHAMTPDAVTARREVSPDSGLSAMEVARRLNTYGPNSLPVPEPKSAMAILVDQVATLPVGLLAVAAAVSLASGGIFDALVIAGV